MRKYLWIILIALFLALRLYGITNPLSEHASWRQADTASMLSNLGENFSIFPQLDYDGPPPNYAELEFPFLPLLAFPFFKLSGDLIPTARAVSIFFSLISLIFLVLLGEQRFGERAAFISGFIYALLPFNVFYNRAILPEPVLMGMSLGALYFFTIYLKRGGWKLWTLTAIFIMLSILSKPSFLFLGLLFLFFLLEEKGLKGLIDWKIWLMLFSALIPPFVYFWFSHSLAESKFLTSLISIHMLPNFLTTLSSTDFWNFLFFRLGERVLTWTGLFVFLLSLALSPFFRKPRFLFIWAISVCLFFAFSTAPVLFQHDYYQLMIVPAFALSLGWLFERASQLKIGKYQLKNVVFGLLIMVGVMVFTEGLSQTGYFWNVDPHPLKIGEKIREFTPEGSLIAIDQSNPVYLFYSQRKGFRILSPLTTELIKDLKEKGAQFLAVTSGEGMIKIPELEGIFPLVEKSPELTLFKLNGG
ncbi:MAG: glycosyltransferase family 39 protein [Caldiserica bacterium]|nr:glycosyltransferase family 39 protein [Caldisericota bacterium]MDH7563038.1 glycosyltransferase family 39 protein [Caldisericota bacterium]